MPELTSAFVVLEDLSDFVATDLTISEVESLSELQYYIKAALPFGSPVNTNYALLHKMHNMGFEDGTSAARRDAPCQVAWRCHARPHPAAPFPEAARR